MRQKKLKRFSKIIALSNKYCNLFVFIWNLVYWLFSLAEQFEYIAKWCCIIMCSKWSKNNNTPAI